jgi:hypothetical protein
MSVTCPFTRHSPHQIFLYDKNQKCKMVTEVSKEELEAMNRLHDICTLEKFETSFHAMEKVVIALTMGRTGDSSLRDSLLAMKSRILISIALSNGYSGTVKLLETSLDDNHLSAAVQ